MGSQRFIVPLGSGWTFYLLYRRQALQVHPVHQVALRADVVVTVVPHNVDAGVVRGLCGQFCRFRFIFTFRAFGRHFYPKGLTFVEGDSDIWLWYINIERIELFSSVHSYEVNRTSFITAGLPA